MAVAHRRSLGQRLEALAFDAYLGLFRSMPVERASGLGARLVGALGPLTPTHAVARTNIRIAFPDISPEDEQSLLREQWRNLGRTFAEFPHLHTFDPYGEDSRISVEGAEILDAVKESGTGAVFISGHFANWEVMAAAIVARGVPCHVTYRQANNVDVDARIIAQRTAYGVNMQAAKGREGGMALLRALKRGETVAIMNDQKNNEGVAAPLFGVDAMTADGATRLARRFGCPLIPLSIRREPNVRFTVVVHEPIPVDRDGEEAADILATVRRINAFVEREVRARPAEWFWVHRRWPREHYKKGAPQPSSSTSASASANASTEAGSM